MISAQTIDAENDYIRFFRWHDSFLLKALRTQSWLRNGSGAPAGNNAQTSVISDEPARRRGNKAQTSAIPDASVKMSGG
jgi:hypothetical protein